MIALEFRQSLVLQIVGRVKEGALKKEKFLNY